MSDWFNVEERYWTMIECLALPKGCVSFDRIVGLQLSNPIPILEVDWIGWQS